MDTKTCWVDIDGARLHVETAGQGTAVTMLHGFLVDSGQWDMEFAALASEARVLRYDARGFGESTIKPGEAYAHHDDLATVLDACGIERTVLLGCSGGAATALDFAVAWPSRVSALVLVGPGYWGRFADRTPAARAFLQALGAFDVPRLVDSSLRAFTDGPHRQPDQVDRTVRERTRTMTERVLHRHNSYYTGAARDQRIPSPDALARLHEIVAPTWLMVGSEDQPEVHELAQELAIRMTNACLHVLSGASHHANLEAPGPVLAALRAAVGVTVR